MRPSGVNQFQCLKVDFLGVLKAACAILQVGTRKGLLCAGGQDIATSGGEGTK